MVDVASTSFFTPDNNAQSIARQRKLAELLQAQSMQQDDPAKMAGGLVVPQNALGGLNKLAQALSGAYISKQADTHEKELEASKAQGLARVLQAGNDKAPEPNFVGPPTAGQQSGGGMQGMLAQALQESQNNPELAPFAQQLMLKDVENKITKSAPIKIGDGESLVDPTTGKLILAGKPKAPSGYTPTPDGGLAPIPGGPGDPKNKPMNEYQGKSALFASRMAEAAPVLDRLKDTNTLEQKFKSSIPVVGNYLASDDFQQLDQAKRNFINATLRQESGAAINQSEFDNAEKQYFPQPGDRPNVIAQKQRNREVAINAMSKAAGPAFSIDNLTQGGEPSADGQPAKSAQGVVSTKEAYDALHSGTVYTEPDGKQYRKP